MNLKTWTWVPAFTGYMTLGNLTFLSLVSLQGKMEIRMIIPIQWSLGEDKRRSISEAGEWQARLSSFSCVWLCATLGTIVHQAPLSMGFSRQEYWAELPCPPPGNLPNPGIEPTSLVSPSWAGVFFSSLETWKPECLRGLGIEKSLLIWKSDSGGEIPGTELKPVGNLVLGENQD